MRASTMRAAEAVEAPAALEAAAAAAVVEAAAALAAAVVGEVALAAAAVEAAVVVVGKRSFPLRRLSRPRIRP
jgi:3-dehydroquinate synthase class II